MLIETGVFDRNDRMLHIGRNLIDRNRDTVSFRGVQFLEFISVGIIDKGCVAERHDVDV